jgi:hypothetical protein
VSDMGSFAEFLLSAKIPPKLPVRFQEHTPSPGTAEIGWKGDGQLLLKATVSQVANGGWTTS